MSVPNWINSAAAHKEPIDLRALKRKLEKVASSGGALFNALRETLGFEYERQYKIVEDCGWNRVIGGRLLYYAPEEESLIVIAENEFRERNGAAIVSLFNEQNEPDSLVAPLIEMFAELYRVEMLNKEDDDDNGAFLTFSGTSDPRWPGFFDQQLRCPDDAFNVICQDARYLFIVNSTESVEVQKVLDSSREIYGAALTFPSLQSAIKTLLPEKGRILVDVPTNA